MTYTEATKKYAQAKAIKKIAEAVIELIDAMTEPEEKQHYEQLALPFAEDPAPVEEPQAAPAKYTKAFPVDVSTIAGLMTARGYADTSALAAAMGATQNAVYKMLKRGTCSRKMMQALETALGVTPGSLWTKKA